MTPASQATGVLLVGHGTRSEIGSAQFLDLAGRIGTALRPTATEPAFLELRQPDIDAAIERLVARHVEHIATVPLLLFAAAHAKEDIPVAVRAALTRLGRGEIGQVQSCQFGCHPTLIELSEIRMREAVDQAVSASAESLTTCLLLVGRGSNDKSATAEMHEFARLRQQTLERIKVEVAFLAMAHPLHQEQMRLIAGQGYRRIIVQPHLLFHGELVELLRRQMSEMATIHAQIQWIVTQPLADLPGQRTRATEMLEKVILDRCEEVGIHVVGISPRD